MEFNLAEELLNTYDANTWLLNRLVADVTHAESLQTPKATINCMNWIVGHVLAGRHEALELLEFTAFWGEDQLGLYRSGSATLTDQEAALEFNFLVDELQRSQELLEAALGAASEPQLQTVVETRRGEKPIWKHVDGLAWHETFHVGQVDLLRAYAHGE